MPSQDCLSHLSPQSEFRADGLHAFRQAATADLPSTAFGWFSFQFLNVVWCGIEQDYRLDLLLTFFPYIHYRSYVVDGVAPPSGK
jgi:hypothetical protein